MNENSPYNYIFENSKEKFKYICFYVVVFISSIISSVLAVIFNEISEYSDKPMKEILFLSIVICVVVVVNATLVYIRNIMPHRYIINKIIKKKKQIIKKILHNNVEKIRTYETSDILVRLNEDMEIIEAFIGETSIECVALIISSIVALALLLYLFLPVTVVAFISTPVFLFIISKISDKIGKNAKDIQEKTTDLNNKLMKSIEGNLEIQVFSKENQFINKFATTLEELKKENLKLKKTKLNMLSIGKTGNIVPIIIIVFMGFYYVKQGVYTLGAWLAMFYLMEFSNSIFTAIPELLSKYKEASVSVKRLKDLQTYFAKPKVEYIEKYEKNSLEIKNVSFSYVDYKKVLHNINVNINQGEKIVVVGRSGCGKSTLVDIICGFLTQKEGEIGIWNHEEFMSFLAYADQEAILFPGTLEENIMLEYKEKEDAKDIFQEILKIVKMDKWINEMQEKEKYNIGRNCKALSGGQRQKVALARALMKAHYTQNAVLVLDEATSYIDIETEKEIIKNIFAIKKLTCIFVAHRIAAYENANKILYMENGQIIECGTHAELIKQKGKYCKLLSYVDGRKSNGENTRL